MRIPSNMIHDIIDDTNKEHITTLLKWLVYEVKSACGDGDAIWYSQFYDINAILPLVEELNKDIKWNGDGSYDRKIGGTIHTKMMFGKPK